MGRQPLQVIRSTEVRSVFKRGLKPELKRLGFKIAKQHGRSGWARNVGTVYEFFCFQFSSWGFFRDHGGEFIVELHFSDRERRTSISDRLWRLLDDESRQEATRLINQAIAAMPGPLPEIYGAPPEGLREARERRFVPLKEVPSLNRDVWFRYATYADVEAWAAFLTLRLPRVIAAVEERLRTMPEGESVFLGTTSRPRDVRGERDAVE